MASFVILIPLLASVIAMQVAPRSAARSEQHQQHQQQQQLPLTQRDRLLNRWRSTIERLERPFPEQVLATLGRHPQYEQAPPQMRLPAAQRQPMEDNDDADDDDEAAYSDTMPIAAYNVDNCSNAIDGPGSCSTGIQTPAAEGSANDADVDPDANGAFRMSLPQWFPGVTKRSKAQSACHCQSINAITKQLLWEPIDMGAGFYPRHALSKVCDAKGCRKLGQICRISTYRVNAIKRSELDMPESYNSSVVNIDCHCVLA